MDILENRARLLVILNYNGYTVESIEADVQGLLDQLAAANSTLQSITLEGSSVQQLQDSLSEVCWKLCVLPRHHIKVLLHFSIHQIKSLSFGSFKSFC